MGVGGAQGCLISNKLNWSKPQTQSGWWLGHPSEKYESQLGWLFPTYGKIKKVPNHQPAIDWTIWKLFPQLKLPTAQLTVLLQDWWIWLQLLQKEVHSFGSCRKAGAPDAREYDDVGVRGENFPNLLNLWATFWPVSSKTYAVLGKKLEKPKATNMKKLGTNR